jgi:mRNA interferase RelE/StbE
VKLPVAYMPAAEQYFKKLKDKPLKEKFLRAIDEIRLDPTIGEAKTGDLAGIYCYDFYHQKTNYELAYRLTENENGEIVVVIMAGTRENFYKEIKRYMK